MTDGMRELSDAEADTVAGGFDFYDLLISSVVAPAGGPGYKDGTSNTMMILPHVEQDNAVADVRASASSQTK